MNYNQSEENARKIKAELEEKGYWIEIFKADISKRKEVSDLVQFALDKLGKIDVLVNNAGITLWKLFTETTEEDWNHIMNTNLHSVFYTAQEVLKDMIQHKSGCIINISSIWGMVGRIL